MITTKYTELFHFFIKNTFYPNLVFEDAKAKPVADYQFLPDPETLAWMKTKGLVFRAGINDFSLYTICAGLNGGSSKVQFAMGDKKLIFGMVLVNPKVMGLVQWPPLNANQVFYLSNLSDDNVAPPENLHLTISQSSISTADVLDSYTGAFQLVWNGAVSAGNTYLLATGSEQKIPPGELIKQGSNTMLKFNLGMLPAGKYSLYINGNYKKSFFATGALKMTPLFGVIEIFLGNSTPENYRLTDENGVISRREYLATVEN